MVQRLEGVGAAAESERPGEAFFAVAGLRGIHGGDSAGSSSRRRLTLRRAAARPPFSLRQLFRASALPQGFEVQVRRTSADSLLLS
jgi:hypothetical protein